MRADRLVATLLLLQARGRVTASEVAKELEVSLKTARRDLEALSIAGIPVYSQAGRGGGWSLLGSARTDLSGLTAAEARTLFLVAGPSSTVAPEAKAALRKLVRALPATFRADAEAAAAAVVIDPSRWGDTTGPASPHLATLQRAVIDGVQVVLTYADRNRRKSQRTVDPLGLVQKGAVWYLVAGTDAGQRTFRVSRIRSVHVTDDPAVRPEGFDLAVAWRSTVASVLEQVSVARAVVRVPGETLPWLRSQFPREVVVTHRLDDGRIEVEVAATSAEMIAQQVAGWGRDLEVMRPPEVRAHLARIGSELVARHGLQGTDAGAVGGSGRPLDASTRS